MITNLIKAKLYQLLIEPSCFMQIKLLSSFYGWINFLVVQTVKNLPANAGDMSLSPGSGRSPGEGNGNPLQYSWWGNPMDRGARRATVRGVAKSQTQFSN